LIFLRIVYGSWGLACRLPIWSSRGSFMRRASPFFRRGLLFSEAEQRPIVEVFPLHVSFSACSGSPASDVLIFFSVHRHLPCSDSVIPRLSARSGDPVRRQCRTYFNSRLILALLPSYSLFFLEMLPRIQRCLFSGRHWLQKEGGEGFPPPLDTPGHPSKS